MYLNGDSINTTGNNIITIQLQVPMEPSIKVKCKHRKKITVHSNAIKGTTMSSKMQMWHVNNVTLQKQMNVVHQNYKVYQDIIGLHNKSITQQKVDVDNNPTSNYNSMIKKKVTDSNSTVASTDDGKDNNQEAIINEDSDDDSTPIFEMVSVTNKNHNDKMIEIDEDNTPIIKIISDVKNLKNNNDGKINGK